MKYRKEIDGLRALAVVPVVLFHAGISIFPGGFIGVDIFFVISGYLISTIILTEINQKRFSFLRFYERRVRRIIPALLLVLFVSIIVSFLVSLPQQSAETSKSAVAALFSVSNFFFWFRSGYFAPMAEFMPLLHTWSLGVEEQFYFLFPIILVFLDRFGISLRKVIFIFGVPLILLSVYISYEKPSAAFYLLPARAWELSLGALLSTYMKKDVKDKILREIISIIGLVIIIASLFLIDSSMVFPGWVVIWPCAGAALIIAFSNGGTLVQRLLSNSTAVFLGLISYSLYLWHWPILSFARMWFAKVHLTNQQSTFCVAFAIILASLTWRFVERPFRKRGELGGGLIAALSVGSVIVLLVAFSGIVTKGFPQRMPLTASRILTAASDLDPLRDRCSNQVVLRQASKCVFGKGNAKPSFVVLGDSHAAAIRSVFENIDRHSDRRGILVWRGACSFLLGARAVPDADHTECTEFKNTIIEALRKAPEIELVILAGRWAADATGTSPEVGGSFRTFLKDEESKELSALETLRVFERSLQRSVNAILALGKRVLIVGDVPEPGFDVPSILALAKLNGKVTTQSLSLEVVSRRNKEVDKIFRILSDGNPSVDFIRIWDYFCTSECKIIDEGMPLYSDDDHITYTAAHHFLSPMLSKRIDELDLWQRSKKQF